MGEDRKQDQVSGDAESVIELPEILDLKAAGPLAAKLLARRGERLGIDASRVERLGGQCLQVLLSTAMTWKTDGVPLAFLHPSQDFVEGLDLLGAPPLPFLDQEPPQ